MKKMILSSIFAVALIAIAGYGVNKSMNSYADLSDLALRNVLALADVENPDKGEGDWEPLGYDKKETISQIFYNDKLHKETSSIECYEDGPTESCTPGHYFRYKEDNGNWSDWTPV